MTTPTFSRQAFEDVASFLPIFGANGFDFGTWVLRQGSFPFVTYHPEVGRFVRTLERHGWVYESPDFLWGPWLRTPEAAGLLSGETLPAATPEQLARVLTVFARQERIVDGSRLEMYQSGLLLAALRRVQHWVEWLPPGEPDAPLPPGVRQDWNLAGSLTRQTRPFGEPARPRPAPPFGTPFSPPHPSSSLTFSEAAQRVHAFISQFEEGYFPPLLMLARLTEETGEIARVLAHQNGKTPKPGEDVGDLEMELADLLFVAICLANEHGLSLERGFARMMDKIERRDRDRWTKKVDLSWDLPEAVSADAGAAVPQPDPPQPEGSMGAYPVPYPSQSLSGEDRRQADIQPADSPGAEAQAVPLDLPLGMALVISAHSTEVQSGEVQSSEGQSSEVQAPQQDLQAEPETPPAADPTPAEPAPTDPLLADVPAEALAQDALSGEAPAAGADLPTRTRRSKAGGGEIAKPAKALARKRTPRK